MTTDTVAPPICKLCGNEIPFGPHRRRGRDEWLARAYCNRTCAGRARTDPNAPDNLADLIEDAEFLLDPTGPRGSRYELARRLGYSNPESLAKRLYRAGRKDLANAFDSDDRR